MKFSRKVKLIAVAPTTGIEDGDGMYDLTFGDIIKVTDGVRRRLMEIGKSSVNIVGSGWLKVCIPAKAGVLPFRVGEEFDLVVDDMGVSLKKQKTEKA